MDPLSIAAGVAGLLTLAGVVTSKGYVVVSKLTNRKKDINTLVNEIASFSGILVGVKEVIASSKPDAFIHENESTIRDAVKSSGEVLKEAEELFKSLDKANAVKYLLKDSVEKQSEQIIAKIERCKAFFILCLQVESSAQSGETEKAAAEMKVQLKVIQSGQEEILSYLDEQSQRELARKRAEILQWLGPTTEKEHEDVCKLRISNSAEWILERDEITAWLSGETSSHLWLSGIHGTGKTVIASKIIETIENVSLDDNGVALAYHYCWFSNSDSHTSERVVGAIISQLLQKGARDQYLPPSLPRLHDKYFSRKGYPTLEELWGVFDELCRDLSKLFLVIDGLDELEDRKGLIQFLKDLSGLVDLVEFKILVASRPEKDLEIAFESYFTVTITPSDNATDIQQYVMNRVNQLEIQKQSEADELVQELVRRADGMFLWVVCQLDQLARVRTAITVDLLRGLPKGLERTFESGLLKLEDNDRVLALEILRWLMYSRRQLSLEELVEAIAVKSGMETLAQVQKAKLRRSSDVFEICGSLVRQSKLTGKLSLAHYSIYEWLSSPKLGSGDPNEFYLDPVISSLSLLRTCVVYLALDDYGSSDFVEKVDKALMAQKSGLDYQVLSYIALFDYACDCWWAHGKEQEAIEPWGKLRDVDIFFGKERNFESWARVARYLYGEYQYPVGMAPIHVAALHGIKWLATFLVTGGLGSRNIRTSDGRLPLHIAIENGNNELIRLLGSSESLINAKDGWERTPLHIAVESGNEMAVTQLVSMGADVNARLLDGRTAPFIAIENSWDKLATYLCNKAYDIRLKDRRCLLHVAAQSGSLAWCTVLLKAHWNMLDAPDQDSWTPLHYAADNGHTEIVRHFLDKEAQPDPGDQNGWTPLHAAVRRRNYSCIALLIDALEGRGTDRPGSSSRYVRIPTQSRNERGSTGLRHDLPWTSSLPRRSLDTKYGRHYQETSAFSGPIASRTPAPKSVQSPLSVDALKSDPEGNQKDSAFPDLLAAFGSPRPKSVDSPLLVAVSEPYLEGIQLLLKHSQVDSIGLYQMPTCLEKALTFADSSVLDILLMEAQDEQIQPLLPAILAKRSEKTNRTLQRKWPTERAHVVLKVTVTSQLSTKLQVVKFILARWPPPPRRLLDDSIYELDCRTWSQDTKDVLSILIEYGALNAAPGDSENPVFRPPLLHTAIRDGNWDLAGFLIDRGCGDIRCKLRGETALLLLARVRRQDSAGQVHLAERLVAEGADLFAVDSSGAGIYHKAVEADNSAFLRWLSDRGVPFDTPDNGSLTPLFRAVEHGSEMVAKELLVWTAKDPSKILELFRARNYGSSVLTAPIEQKRATLLALLVQAEKDALKVIPLTEEDTMGRKAAYTSALCSAISTHFEAGFDCLLAHAPDISHTDTQTGETPLHVAVRTYTPSTGSALESSPGIDASKSGKYFVESLLSKGANVEARTSHHGKTALDLAMSNVRRQPADTLLEHGAKPELKHFQTAVDTRDKPLLFALLPRWRDVDLTQLSLTGFYEEALVLILLERGARPDHRHLVLAAERGSVTVAEKVLEAFPDDRDTQFRAFRFAKFRGGQAVTQLISDKLGDGIEEAYRDIQPDTKGGTLLHSAVRRGRPKEVEMLLWSPRCEDEGFLRITDEDEKTALALAISACHWDSARLLIWAKAGIPETRMWARSTGVDMWIEKLEELILQDEQSTGSVET